MVIRIHYSHFLVGFLEKIFCACKYVLSYIGPDILVSNLCIFQIEKHDVSPSRVLHVRGLREYATQNDIVDAIKQFGRVTYIMMIPRNKQALVELEVSFKFLS